MTAAEAIGWAACCGPSLPTIPMLMPERNGEREDNTVSVIDTASDEVIATIEVGTGPEGEPPGCYPRGHKETSSSQLTASKPKVDR